MRYPTGSSKEDFEKNWYNAQGFGVKTSYGFHEGDDYNLRTGGNTDLGQPILSIADGEVTSVHEHTTGFGKHVHIKHDGKWGTVYSHYAHLNTITVSVGQKVSEGQQIGTLGSTGNSKFAHLHFAIKNQPTGIDAIAKTQEDLKKWIDPLPFIKKYMNSSQNELEACLEAHGKLMSEIAGKDEQIKSLTEQMNEWKSKYEGKATRVIEVEKEMNTFMETLASKLTTIVDKAAIMEGVQRLLTNEDTLQKSVNKLEKEYYLLEQEKADEVKSLKEEIESLATELFDVQERYQRQIQNLKQRIEQLENSKTNPTQEKAVFESVSKLVEQVKKLFERKNAK